MFLFDVDLLQMVTIACAEQKICWATYLGAAKQCLCRAAALAATVATLAASAYNVATAVSISCMWLHLLPSGACHGVCVQNCSVQQCHAQCGCL
jgi:hypothetical protein